MQEIAKPLYSPIIPSDLEKVLYRRIYHHFCNKKGKHNKSKKLENILYDTSIS